MNLASRWSNAICHLLKVSSIATSEHLTNYNFLFQPITIFTDNIKRYISQPCEEIKKKELRHQHEKAETVNASQQEARAYIDGSSLFLYDVQVSRMNCRREFTLLWEQATSLDNLLLWDLADLEAVFVGQLPVEYLEVLLEPVLLVGLDDGRHSLLIYPSQSHLKGQKNGCVSVIILIQYT